MQPLPYRSITDKAFGGGEKAPLPVAELTQKTVTELTSTGTTLTVSTPNLDSSEVKTKCSYKVGEKHIATATPSTSTCKVMHEEGKQ